MNKIKTTSEVPSAREFYDTHYSDDAVVIMRDFAKLHVKAAIEECIESAPSGSSTDTVSYEDVVEALKNCYPDENFK